jgi:hypothetical protein
VSLFKEISMKIKIGAYLATAVLTMSLLSACGGGDGGSSGGAEAVTVNALKNPLLVNYSTTVVASFAPYTSAVKAGSDVTFTVSAPATFSSVSSAVTTRSVKTSGGGLAWVNVKSPQPGKFTVAASSGPYAGSTSVSVINQPASVTVTAGLNKPITGLGGLSFNVVSDLPAPTFTNFTSIKGAGFTVQTNPVPPAAGVDSTGVALVSASGVDVTPGSLFRLDYLVVDKGVPIFNVTDLSATLAGASAVPVTPDFFFFATYYDVDGKKLYP